MKVKELIEELSKIADKELEVQVAVRQYNQDYPVAYCNLTKNSVSTFGVCRLTISLPGDDKSFMYTGTRKTK